MPKVILYKRTDEMNNVIYDYCVKNALTMQEFLDKIGQHDNWYRSKKKGMSVKMYRKICAVVPEFKNITLVNE